MPGILGQHEHDPKTKAQSMAQARNNMGQATRPKGGSWPGLKSRPVGLRHDPHVWVRLGPPRPNEAHIV
jgi:hypothetical protein